uniref:Uncharacterized protein n=1 Tax=Arundo donax TaxID=35708 RepID=A0A0A9UB57_ARUDO
MVHSQTIEGLRVHGVGLRSIDVVAPMLKKFTLNTHSACDLSVTFSALMLENVNWYYGLFPCFVGIGDKWGLRSVGLQLEERVYLLWLKIEALDYRPSRGGNLMPKIAKLPNFSILKIPLVTWVHVSGGVVLNTLEICNSIKRLKLILHLKSGKPCLLNCPCDQPNNWRNQFIT